MTLTQDDIFRKDAGYGKEFHVHDGHDVKNLRELLAYLPKMSDEQFRHHVHGEKNDFAQWIEDVHGPGSVSELIREAKTRDELIGLLTKKIEEYAQRQEAKQDPERILEEPIEPKAAEEAEKIDDDRFDNLKEEYAERNEEMQEKFDRIAEEFEKAMKDEIPEELERMEEEQQERYEELRDRTSELRKEGRDCLMASLYLKRFPAKLGIAKATGEKSDFRESRKVLDEAEQELEEIESKDEIDVKREVLEMAGLDDSVKKEEEA